MEGGLRRSQNKRKIKMKNNCALSFDTLESPVGVLQLVASDHAVHAVLWENEREGRVRLGATPQKDRSHPLLQKVKAQLSEYFRGARTEFDLPLQPTGTAFQLKAWTALRRIPYGSTLSYGEQAKRLGDSRYARAVGAANGKNPISILVPCHRVVGSTGHLTGFAGGLAAKRFLLDLESSRG
jgi:methylated-DNA-[protein]-cysteine S-methyltransferase